MALLDNITYSPGEPMQDCFDKINAAIDAINAALGGTNNLKIATIPIGDWDMDTNAFKIVDIGMQKNLIRSISVVVRPDSNSLYAPLDVCDSGGDPNGWVQFDTYDSGPTEIYLGRLTGSSFDSTNFDSTSYNRGYITVIYTE